MIDAVINLVELEGGIRAPAFSDDMIESIENPAVDHCSCCRWLRPAVSDPGYRIIKQIP